MDRAVAIVSAFVLLVVLAAGCRDDEVETPSSDERGVAVVVTGVRSGGGLCPVDQFECAAAIRLDGEFGPVEDGAMVQAAGWYDGARLLASRVVAIDDPWAEPPANRFDRAEVEAASQRLVALMEAGVLGIQGGFSSDGAIRVPIEALDADGRAAVDALAPVDAIVFVELLDRPLAELPVWRNPVPGTIDIVTSPVRSLGGMAALYTGELHLDAALNCLYLGSEDARLLPMWPYGYSAAAADGAATLFAPDGTAVAVAGETMELGGGGGPADGLPAGTNLCGAAEVWYVSA